MSTYSPPEKSTTREARWIIVIFTLLLGFHLWSISVGWFHTNLPGAEFRQAQTAVSALFIQRENNFSLAYPTPVLGPPWSIPMEFPLYQWSVVALSNLTKWSLTSSGRTISALCFYLSLPACYLLLASLRLSKPQRLIVLSFMLTCPLYIFYARAFLIETMALMFALWYLAALVRAMQRCSWVWLVVANFAGIGAGLVKVTTFLAFLLPAFALSVYWLWKSRPQGTDRGKNFIQTFGRLIAIHALPFCTSIGWVRYSDSIKALNFSGQNLQSGPMTQFNFGPDHRFDSVVWHQHWDIIFREIAQPLTLVFVAVLALLFARRSWGLILAAIAFFFAVQVIFPTLYAWHDYYYVAIAFLPMLIFGLVSVEILKNHRIPRLTALAIFFLVQGLQAFTYFKNDYQAQKLPGSTLGGLAQVIKVTTQPNDVLIVAGDDWSSIVPYFTERRALMISIGRERDRDYLEKAFSQFSSREAVTTLILIGDQRNNALLQELADQYFDIDSQPAFTWLNQMTVYFRQDRVDPVRDLVRGGSYHGITLAPEIKVSSTPTFAGRIIDIIALSPHYQKLFRSMTPRPTRFFSTVGPQLWEEEEGKRLRYFAHPETKLWFDLPAGPHHFKTAIEIVPNAYHDIPFSEATDGVELVLTTITTGQRSVIQKLYLNPRDNPADRGLYKINWAFAMPSAGQVEVQVNSGPLDDSKRDWTLLDTIEFK